MIAVIEGIILSILTQSSSVAKNSKSARNLCEEVCDLWVCNDQSLPIIDPIHDLGYLYPFANIYIY